MVSWGPIHRLYSDWWPEQSCWTSLKRNVGLGSKGFLDQCHLSLQPDRCYLQKDISNWTHIKEQGQNWYSHFHWFFSVDQCRLVEFCCNSQYVLWFFWLVLNPALSCLFPGTGMTMNLALIATLGCLPILMTTPLPGPVLEISSQSCETLDKLVTK